MFRVAIRVDASFSIGSGHVSRCLTLASALAEKGASICFLSKNCQGGLSGRISEQGFEVTVLPAELTPTGDAEACRSLLGPGVDLMVVDHYGLDFHWENLMRPSAHAIMVIDDLADRRHDCDLLLDQNLQPPGPNVYDGLVPPDCIMLLGPEYTLLREEFRCELQQLRPRDGRLNHLLLSFGGTDPYNLTGRILEELSLAELSLSGDVVIGRGHPQESAVKSLCMKGPWRLHVDTDQMARLMANADLGLGAGGSTHWERCVLGLPTLVVTVAENQIATTNMLHERGACHWLGSAEMLRPGVIPAVISEFAKGQHRLLEMSRAARKIVPGAEGASRVASEACRLVE